MWQTPRDGVEKSTPAPSSDDRYENEKLEKQEIQSGYSKKQKSKTFGKKPKKELDVDEGAEYKVSDSMAETADSCFISGPVSKPVNIEDVDPRAEDKTELVVADNKADNHALQSILIGQLVDCVDSGCIENESDDKCNAGSEGVAVAATTNLYRSLAFHWEEFYKQDDDGDTALHLTCIAGCDSYFEGLTALIYMAPHPCLFNIRNDLAQTSLHLAALTAQPNVLRVLLLAGAEPTVRDRHGNTALHLACIAGELQCVRALTGTSAASKIHSARSTSHLEIRNYGGERCVHIAAHGGHIEILRILVSHGADINAREGKSGLTPLHIAIECRNEELTKFLLDECNKLNLETATYAGMTAYQFAWLLDNAHMQNILQKRGAEPLTPDTDYDSSDEEEASNVAAIMQAVVDCLDCIE